MLINGKQIAATFKQTLKNKIDTHINQTTHRRPCLAVIRVGQDAASSVYVAHKIRACQEVGIESISIHEESLSQSQLLACIERFNQDKKIDAILVQLPLIKGIDETHVLKSIDPRKDVDGFHAIHVGHLWQGQLKHTLLPCTPQGVMHLIRHVRQDLSGLHALVVGRSQIVGRPCAQLLLLADCTVTIAHRYTQDLPKLLKQADIVVAAAGQPGLIRGEHLKTGAIVIDVGTTRIHGQLKGDVDFESAALVASAITPVPGGVGPMTIAMLLENTWQCYLKHIGI